MKTFLICQDIIFQLSRLSQHLSSCFLNYKNILKPSSLILCLLFSFDILILYLAFCEDEWILILLVEASEMKLIYYIFSVFYFSSCMITALAGQPFLYVFYSKTWSRYLNYFLYVMHFKSNLPLNHHCLLLYCIHYTVRRMLWPRIGLLT